MIWGKDPVLLKTGLTLYKRSRRAIQNRYMGGKLPSVRSRPPTPQKTTKKIHVSLWEQTKDLVLIFKRFRFVQFSKRDNIVEERYLPTSADSLL